MFEEHLQTGAEKGAEDLHCTLRPKVEELGREEHLVKHPVDQGLVDRLEHLLQSELLPLLLGYVVQDHVCRTVSQALYSFCSTMRSLPISEKMLRFYWLKEVGLLWVRKGLRCCGSAGSS